MDDRETGTVKWYDPSKGFGFIKRDTGDDVFMHRSSLESFGYDVPDEGTRVTFKIGVGAKGTFAEDVQRA